MKTEKRKEEPYPSVESLIVVIPSIYCVPFIRQKRDSISWHTRSSIWPAANVFSCSRETNEKMGEGGMRVGSRVQFHLDQASSACLIYQLFTPRRITREAVDVNLSPTFRTINNPSTLAFFLHCIAFGHVTSTEVVFA